VFSKKPSDDIYAEIVAPYERFRWEADESVTARRRRRVRIVQALKSIGLAGGTVFLIVLLARYGPSTSFAHKSDAERAQAVPHHSVFGG
jgi:hypothetical protein